MLWVESDGWNTCSIRFQYITLSREGGLREGGWEGSWGAPREGEGGPPSLHCFKLGGPCACVWCLSLGPGGVGWLLALRLPGQCAWCSNQYKGSRVLGSAGTQAHTQHTHTLCASPTHAHTRLSPPPSPLNPLPCHALTRSEAKSTRTWRLIPPLSTPFPAMPWPAARPSSWARTACCWWTRAAPLGAMPWPRPWCVGLVHGVSPPCLAAVVGARVLRVILAWEPACRQQG